MRPRAAFKQNTLIKAQIFGKFKDFVDFSPIFRAFEELEGPQKRASRTAYLPTLV
jgi:hypothetical protein